MLLLLFLALSQCIPLSHKPVHKITVRNHLPELVSSLLYKAYEEAYSLNPSAKAVGALNSQSYFLQFSGRPDCVEEALFRYFLQTVRLVSKSYPASECRMNTNDLHLSVLKPVYNFHATVHGSLGIIQDELKYKTQAYIELLQITDESFYNYSRLDYNMECLAEYQQLMQIMYRETLLEATLQRVVEVPDACSFSHVNLNFGTEYASEVKVQIPVNATFVCQSGPSSTCRKSTAVTSNSRYRHLE